jgi:hypothetical protein
MRLPILLVFFVLTAPLLADEPFGLNRCELVPLAEQQVSFQIDGVEKTRWHFGAEYPRPFFYPFNGPAGTSLTRMGHPGAENHDHHRSVWFAHHDVAGVDFWSDRTEGRVRQKHWYAYCDGDDEAVMATVTGWYDGEGKELGLESRLSVFCRPGVRDVNERNEGNHHDRHDSRGHLSETHTCPFLRV